MLLDGRIAVISGAASKRGIGLATARLFAAHGAIIAILDLDQQAADEAASSIGEAHRGHACDVTDREACRRAVDAVLGAFGRIDILVNNAGITQPSRLMEIEPRGYDAVLDVSLRGTLQLSQAVVPHMRDRRAGAIVCMSSVSAQRGGGIFGGPHYSAAKAGVLGLAKAMARELGPDGIRVNCITPGLIDTDITEGKLTDAMRAEITKGIPLNRLGEASDVAGACLFLASDLSSYVTGAVIDVNGGMLIHGVRAMQRARKNTDNAILADKARMIRRETVKLTDICGSGHYGSAFSMAELVAALYYEFLHVDPAEPTWADRDRFTMGKGHAAIGLYSILADLGFFSWDELYTYTRLGSPFGDHPDMKKVKGADFGSGSIGHNLSVSVGMALGLRLKESPGRVVCLMGDGEQAEGQVWEAAMAAAHFKLTNLVGIVDINKVGSDGEVATIMGNEPLDEKWRAFGWQVRRIDGHDLDAVCSTLDWALNGDLDGPAMILADTIAGKGVSFMERTWQWHLGYLGPADRNRALKELEHEPA